MTLMPVKTKNKKNAKSRTVTKSKPRAASKPVSRSKTLKTQTDKPRSAPATKPKSIVLSGRRPSVEGQKRANNKIRVVQKITPHIPGSEDRRSGKGLRLPQYNYMKPPGMMHDFQVGDVVEVYCDHEKNRDRVRGWIRGIVVQVDNKLVAVQFRSNVFLTDGWMVPDRILWYPLTSEHMRSVPGKKVARREEKVIPEY